MTSESKEAANKNNALRSTGPRSAEGKAKSSRNSWKHGLTVEIFHDPELSRGVEKLAKAIVGDRKDPARLQHARAVAAAMIELQRVATTRADQWNLELVRRLEDVGVCDNAGSAVEAGGRGEPLDHETEALLRIFPRWVALDRYQRSAQARLRRSLRVLIG